MADMRAGVPYVDQGVFNAAGAQQLYDPCR